MNCGKDSDLCPEIAAGEFQAGEEGRDSVQMYTLSSDHILGTNLEREMERRGGSGPTGGSGRQDPGRTEEDDNRQFCMCLEATGSRQQVCRSGVEKM